jgi:hypothetical protein
MLFVIILEASCWSEKNNNETRGRTNNENVGYISCYSIVYSTLNCQSSKSIRIYNGTNQEYPSCINLIPDPVGSCEIQPTDKIRWDFGNEMTNGSNGRIIVTTHLISIQLISTRLQWWESILPGCWIVSDFDRRIRSNFNARGSD